MLLTRRKFLLQTSAGLALLSTLKAKAIANALQEVGLKDYYKDDFQIGTALSTEWMEGMDPFFTKLVAKEFGAITMENDMKWEIIQPEPGKWNFELADRFVDYGKKHDMYMVGHVLVWHSQTPDWVFQDEAGKPASRSVLLARMKNHIEALAGRYKGRLAAWDVVNEAVDEENGWRQSDWFKILGPDFMEHAFRFAHEVDPNAHLLYNDYNMHLPGKRDFVVGMLNSFKKRKVPIHGVGMQGHVGLDFPEIQQFEDSIKAYAAAGARVHITEMDVDALPIAWDHTGAEISDTFKYSEELNPYPDGLPEEVEQQLTDRYVEFFKLFIKHRDKIDRVTLWGIGDGDNWKNDFPVKGRTNYTMLFDRDYKRKAAYDAVVNLRKKK